MQTSRSMCAGTLADITLRFLSGGSVKTSLILQINCRGWNGKIVLWTSTYILKSGWLCAAVLLTCNYSQLGVYKDLVKTSFIHLFLILHFFTSLVTLSQLKGLRKKSLCCRLLQHNMWVTYTCTLVDTQTKKGPCICKEFTLFAFSSSQKAFTASAKGWIEI